MDTPFNLVNTVANLFSRGKSTKAETKSQPAAIGYPSPSIAHLFPGGPPAPGADTYTPSTGAMPGLASMAELAKKHPDVTQGQLRNLAQNALNDDLQNCVSDIRNR